MIGYFLEDEERDDEENNECINIQDSNPHISSTCEELAYWGECHMNPRYMMENCAKSCLQCLPAG